MNGDLNGVWAGAQQLPNIAREAAEEHRLKTSLATQVRVASRKLTRRRLTACRHPQALAITQCMLIRRQLQANALLR
jgi:hypothetical protein